MTEQTTTEPDATIIDLMDRIEAFRLQYGTRLTAQQVGELHAAETAVRGIVTENEALRQQQRDARKCQTCKGEIYGGEHGGTERCMCWGKFAEALQMFMGMDYDGAALMAGTMWDGLDAETREYVWSGEWVAEHPEQPDIVAAMVALENCVACGGKLRDYVCRDCDASYEEYRPAQPANRT